MKTNQRKEKRNIMDVTSDEVLEAMKEFCQKLNIPGSIAGSYDFYEVIYKEYVKGRNHQDEINRF
jgi:hypothetical protein